MALNSSGPISLAGTTTGQSIEIELGGNGTTQISLNDSTVRALAGVPSGAISMPTDFWGKSSVAWSSINLPGGLQNIYGITADYNMIFGSKGLATFANSTINYSLTRSMTTDTNVEYVGSAQRSLTNSVIIARKTNSTNRGVIATSANDFTSLSYTFTCIGLPTSIIYSSIYDAYFVLTDLGYLYTSTNQGVTWSELTAFRSTWNGGTGVYGPISIIEESGTLYVIGSTAKMFKSTDQGVTWSNVAGLALALGTTNVVNKIMYALSNYIVIGDSGKLAYSSDAVTWTSSSAFTTAFGSTNDAICMAYRPDDATLYVAGQNGKLVYTTNLTSWTNSANFTTAFGSTKTVFSLNARTGVGYQVVAVGQKGTVVTGTGNTWSNSTSSPNTDTRIGGDVKAAIWTGSKFAVVGDGAGFATSTDGVSWSRTTALSDVFYDNITPGFESNPLIGVSPLASGIAYDGTTYVVVGGSDSGADTNQQVCATSTDGVTWTYRSAYRTALNAAPAATYTYARSILYANSMFLVFGNDQTGSNYVVKSTDSGVSWTRASCGNIRTAIWDGSKFCGCGNAQVGTSTDGTTWSYSTVSFASYLNSVAYSSTLGLYVIVSSSGATYFTSTNFSTWTLRNLPVAFTAITNLIWSSKYSKFFVLGTFGGNKVLYSSADGINWTQVNSFTSNALVNCDATVLTDSTLGLFVGGTKQSATIGTGL